jgi:hypothetical protein
VTFLIFLREGAIFFLSYRAEPLLDLMRESGIQKPKYCMTGEF